MFKTLYSVFNTCHFLKSSKSLHVSARIGHPQVLIVVFLRRLLSFYSVMLVRPFVFRVCLLLVSLPACDKKQLLTPEDGQFRLKHVVILLDMFPLTDAILA
jgi:hypothetical protein